MRQTRKPKAAKFCSCVKQVRSYITPRPGSNKESAAIAICTKSMLQTKGRTLKKVRCLGKKPMLITQKKFTRKNRSTVKRS